MSSRGEKKDSYTMENMLYLKPVDMCMNYEYTSNASSMCLLFAESLLCSFFA